jgi:hypothetical protein
MSTSQQQPSPNTMLSFENIPELIHFTLYRCLNIAQLLHLERASKTVLACVRKYLSLIHKLDIPLSRITIDRAVELIDKMPNLKKLKLDEVFHFSNVRKLVDNFMAKLKPDTLWKFDTYNIPLGDADTLHSIVMSGRGELLSHVHSLKYGTPSTDFVDDVLRVCTGVRKVHLQHFRTFTVPENFDFSHVHTLVLDGVTFATEKKDGVSQFVLLLRGLDPNVFKKLSVIGCTNVDSKDFASQISRFTLDLLILKKSSLFITSILALSFARLKEFCLAELPPTNSHSKSAEYAAKIFVKIADESQLLKFTMGKKMFRTVYLKAMCETGRIAPSVEVVSFCDEFYAENRIQINNRGYEYANAIFPNLKEISCYTRLWRVGKPTFQNWFYNLQRVSICGYNFTPYGMDDLFKFYPNLKDVHILAGATVEATISHANIEKLELEDFGIHKLYIRNCPKLQQMNVTSCLHKTLVIEGDVKSLKCVSIENCSRINWEEFFESIVKLHKMYILENKDNVSADPLVMYIDISFPKYNKSTMMHKINSKWSQNFPGHVLCTEFPANSAQDSCKRRAIELQELWKKERLFKVLRTLCKLGVFWDESSPNFEDDVILSAEKSLSEYPYECRANLQNGNKSNPFPLSIEQMSELMLRMTNSIGEAEMLSMVQNSPYPLYKNCVVLRKIDWEDYRDRVVSTDENDFDEGIEGEETKEQGDQKKLWVKAPDVEHHGEQLGLSDDDDDDEYGEYRDELEEEDEDRLPEEWYHKNEDNEGGDEDEADQQKDNKRRKVW